MRCFSAKQKAAVQLVQDMVGHADHIVPHSKGGEWRAMRQSLSQGGEPARGTQADHRRAR
jgi:hypothetical protein